MAFERKLTPQQKDAIFKKYVRATEEEQYHFARDESVVWGVSRSCIQRIIRDKKRLRAYIEDRQRIFDLQTARMTAHLEDAVNVHLDIIKDAPNYPQMYKSTPQNSANALMDRIGFKPKKDAEEAMVVRFAVEPQMPKRESEGS